MKIEHFENGNDCYLIRGTWKELNSILQMAINNRCDALQWFDGNEEYEVKKRKEIETTLEVLKELKLQLRILPF